jgi:hypothetical protein
MELLSKLSYGISANAMEGAMLPLQLESLLNILGSNGFSPEKIKALRVLIVYCEFGISHGAANPHKWKQLKTKIIRRDNCCCAVCKDNKVSNLVVHHMDYMYSYEDTPEKLLITLCNRCHSRAHPDINFYKGLERYKTIKSYANLIGEGDYMGGLGVAYFLIRKAGFNIGYMGRRSSHDKIFLDYSYTE